jgi:hypothetical protein
VASITSNTYHTAPALPSAGHAPDNRRGKMRRKLVSAVTAFILAATGGAAAVAHASSHEARELDRVRHATARFRSLKAADSAQYKEFYDVNGIACIDMPGTGAMGVHFVNQAFVGDAVLNPLAPEALVYAPDGRGHLKLAAVEYIVIKAAWDATNTAPPSLFGTTFDFTDSPNRYGLPAFYSLHAWVWKHNPAGTLKMWNPKVNCAGYAGHAGMSD